MSMEKGQNVVIGLSVIFGESIVIGNNVTIYDGTSFGNNIIIHDNVVIGKQPTRAKSSILPEVGKLSPTIIGSGVTLGTSSIIYAEAQLGDDVFVADLATVRERVSVGEKTIVGRGVAIENDCKIGRNCKLETNCYITAYSELGDYVFIAPYVVTTNDNFMARGKERFDKFKGVTIKDGGRIGANATILPGKTINEDGTVAAGSIVSKDVEKESLVLGSPAKSIGNVPFEQLLRNQ